MVRGTTVRWPPRARDLVGWTLALALLACLAAGCGPLRLGDGDATAERETREFLQALLGERRPPYYVTPDREGARLWKQTREFYERREWAPAWTERRVPTSRMAALLEAIRESREDGLDPDLYSVEVLDDRRATASEGFLIRKGFEPEEAARIDAWLTWLYLKHSSDLADGLADLAHADPTWHIRPEAHDPVGHLEQALAANRVRESLRELAPRDRQYAGMRKALAEYRAIAERGGWPAVPASLRLKPGQASAHVPLLAERLAASGDYAGPVPPAGEPAGYGDRLQQAVKRFQARHGLAADGVVGPAVVAALNVPVDRRIQQIELNMERWRWLPRQLGDRYILVNIPEFRLEVWDRERLVMDMPVVVGRKDTQTPIFNHRMTYLVFSPYWNVPPGIASSETLPALQRDPSFLERNNMEVIDTAGRVVDPAGIDWENPGDLRFRQRPGAANSLGLVKFMFPNEFDVYLHDTPAQSLFGRAVRAFSHGCVRVADPVALAEYVLRDQRHWTRDRIEAAMQGGEEVTVKLREPLPVFLGYWTARVSPEGLVQFREDVYGLDQRQRARLAAHLNQLRKTAAAARRAETPATATPDPRSTRRSDPAARPD